jgi:hypothetical protein
MEIQEERSTRVEGRHKPINCLIFHSWVPPVWINEVKRVVAVAADQGSTSMTVEAAVKFNPTPPALKKINKGSKRRWKETSRR